MIGDKKCSVCKQEKPVSEYYKKGSYKQSYCKECYRIAWMKKKNQKQDYQYFHHDPKLTTI
jgi:hypothetical protein